ncbi:DUF397 domain-containing protein [Spirilliplanes yamanashiensis]|uniref:DUF397 domain-containing protein n=1 Tax=Spirilliplanes yamanashiensis TaxID=42233 RepID=A0A8J3Y858_9ACTN|nr:DUF397 domain-containing protein [Spirilliplanes yamanashiensis]GIJ03756.1 hypothetical protein Sya03_31080 [Spirilliplanes yamanashiensis]
MSPETGRLVWRRSPACGNGACVEVAFDGDRVLVRDSKHPEREPLAFTTEEWRSFTAGVVAGAFTQN